MSPFQHHHRIERAHMCTRCVLLRDDVLSSYVCNVPRDVIYAEYARAMFALAHVCDEGDKWAGIRHFVRLGNPSNCVWLMTNRVLLFIGSNVSIWYTFITMPILQYVHLL